MLLLTGTRASQTGDALKIINNDSTDAISGTFASVTESGTPSSGGDVYLSGYTGGDGNDLALTGQTASVPTVVTAAAGTVATSGTTIALSVLGAGEFGASDLTYTWAATQIPTGAGSPTFSVNSTNAAKASSATVDFPGAYTFEVTITDGAGLSTTSDVNVTVNQVPTLSVSAASLTVGAGQSQQLEVSEVDQFGDDMDTTDATWSVAGTDSGTIDTDGVYTAPSDANGTYTITATNGSASATATVTVPVSSPDLSAAESSDGSGIDVSWDFSDTASNNATGFDLVRAVNGSSSYSEIAASLDSTFGQLH